MGRTKAVLGAMIHLYLKGGSSIEADYHEINRV